MTDNRRQMDSATARRFILGGKAKVTLVSRKTGTRYTYSIKASADGSIHFVALLTGADNESAYSYIGTIRRDVFSHGGRKAKVAYEAPSVRAFAWAWNRIARGIDVSDLLECWHEGQCARCGRTLTVPESIDSGFGPECRGKALLGA